MAEAIRYALSRWQGLIRFLDDGRIELDSNPVERSIRPIALNRKNALFAGSDDGAENWAVLATLIERRDPLAETEMRGHVEPVQPRLPNSEFAILGVRITTNAATNFRLGDDVILGAATWNFDLGFGAFVRARGRAVGEREILATDVWYVNCTCLD